MKIGPFEHAQPPQPDGERQPNRNEKAGRAEDDRRPDTVEISRSGRERLAESRKTDPKSADETDGVTNTEANKDKAQVDAVDQERKAKIEQAKQRIESDYYDSREVKERIARRIADDLIG
jgi:DNA-binding MarR family transcriptional regulator